jgi:hypothetical protein
MGARPLLSLVQYILACTGGEREGQREKELGREEESEKTESKVHCVSSFYFC